MQDRTPIWKRGWFSSAISRHRVGMAEYSRRHWFFGLVQFGAVVLTVVWSYRLPPPGYAIGVLAVLAAVMSVHIDKGMSSREQALWMLLIGALLVIEFRTIKKDRADFAAAEAFRRKQENAQFQVIADGLKDAIKESQVQFAEEMSGIQDASKTMVGGDSFCYLDLTRLITPEFFVRGKYPLHGVVATIQDFGEMNRIASEVPIKEHRPPNLQEMLAAQVEIQLGEMPPNHGQPLFPIPLLLQKNQERDLDVLFLAFNGYWQEHICLRRPTNNIPGGMALAATTIVRRRGKVILRQVDETYPKDQTCN